MKSKRWNDLINKWLAKFPDIILTDEQYASLEEMICEYGDDRWSSGLDTGADNAYYEANR
jgi:hypothetical protein